VVIFLLWLDCNANVERIEAKWPAPPEDSPQFACCHVRGYTEGSDTASVATELANHGISANVVAVYYHDHIFVPEQKAEEALEILRRLSANMGRAQEDADPKAGRAKSFGG